MPFPFPFTMFGANRSSNSGGGGASCDFTYCYGGSWVQGKVGRYGLTFDGSGDGTTGEDYVDINNYSDITALVDDFTIQSWIKFGDTSASPSNGYGFAVSTLQQLGGSPWLYGFALARSGGGATHTDARGKIAFLTAGDGTWDEAFTNDAGDAGVNVDGNWHHVVGKRESGTSTLYIDGVAQTETTSIEPDTTSGMVLGRHYYNSDSLYFSGSVDEVAVWNVPLTPAQISLLSTGSARADSFTPPFASDGAWLSPGKDGSGYALHFPGGSGEVDITNKNDLGLADGTVAFWAKINDASNIQILAAASHPTLQPGNAHRTSWLMYHSSNKLWIEGGNGSGYWYGPTPAGFDTTGLTLTDWNHYVMTWESPIANSSNDAKLYINGADQGITVTANPNPMIPGGNIAAQKVQLGTGWDAGGYTHMTGSMDEFGIWDVPLSAGDIASLYGGTLSNAISASNLILYYDFDGGPGNSTVVDRSTAGNDHTGNFVGMSGGTTGSLLLYYDFEIGDSQPGASNFPANDQVYDVVTASFHGPTAHTGTMSAGMSVADFGAWGQGKLGKYSLDFDGTDDYTLTANNSSLNYYNKASAFTATGWVKNNTTSWQYLWGKCDTAGKQPGWWVSLDSSGVTKYIYFRVNDGIDGYDRRLYGRATGDIADGDWHHVTIVKTTGYSSVADLKIYLDGTSLSISDGGSSAALLYGPSSSVGMRLGDMGFGSGEYDGQIDEFSFWSGSLNQANITSLAAGAKANAIAPTSSVVASNGDWLTPAPASKLGTYSMHFPGGGGIGAEQYISCSNMSDLIPASGSVAFWARITYQTVTYIAAGCLPDSNGGNADMNWAFYGSGNTIYANVGGRDVTGGNTSYQRYAYKGATLSSANQANWNHFVMTWTNPINSSADIKMYLNGVEKSDGSGQGSQMGFTVGENAAANGLEVILGDCFSEDPLPLYNLTGSMDEFGIWNTTLDQGAIDDLYNSGTGARADTVSASNLVCYYDFEGGPGSTVLTDRSTAGLDHVGTFMNAGWDMGNAAGPTPTLVSYYDMECNGPGSPILKDLSGNDLSGTLTNMSTGSCGSG